MTPVLGGLLATFGAFCYALSSVAIAKSAQSAQGRGNDVFLSILLTAAVAGGLWVVIGPPLPDYESALLYGVGYFAAAGILANVIGRLTLFRSVELSGAIETGLIRRLIPVFAALFAFLLLGEIITPVIVIAFFLVTGGVLIMMLRPFQKGGALAGTVQRSHAERARGRALAVVSAGGYGGSFVARKLAMITLPDPLLGVFIGALTGLLWFGTSSVALPRSRVRVRLPLRRPSGWQFLAASAMTIGQIAQFFALRLANVTSVAIISSVEMFFAAWLAAHIFKTERAPGSRFYVAALMAAVGVILLAVAPAVE